MIGKEQSTLENIHEAGKKEFLAKGFQAASLRNIVKEAGVTTGAFYGYYKSKEALFDQLVGEQARAVMARYKQAHEDFAKMSPEEQEADMSSISYECMDWMVNYVYDHPDAFKLLICCSKGTKYEHMIHDMVEIEVEGTQSFIKNLKGLGREVPEVDPQLVHILASGLLTAFFEMVVHDMTKAQAVSYVRELREFYTAGWEKVMGL